MKTLLIIDGNAMIHRAFHALPKTFTTKEGTPAGALYGLSRILLKIIKEGLPEYAAVCFDRPEPTFRKEEFEEYKAHRPETPDELVDQIVGARELFREFGIKAFEAPGFEADDLIASLAERFRTEPELQIVILTGDLDTLQLVEGEKVVVRTPKKGISETVTYDEQAVHDRYGLGPANVPDYKALAGDSSDNIKGVSGVGPKTAAQLIREFGGVEQIFSSIAPGHRLYEKISGQKGNALKAKELVTLRRDVPVSVDGIEDLFWKIDGERLLAYFDRLGFSSLALRLRGKKGEKKPADNSQQGRMFG